ncbi:MAG: UDP-3-O-acyl-N-acetylglucosamine deacetylase [Parachlamydiaceae bacterium]|nr:UDP-3-O-acyl-N-acetylglucosamine deacetylase [Parachlamydiaceae bacterium]
MAAVHPTLKTVQRKQQTIKREVTFSGLGIHTGTVVSMRFSPAKEGSGILFKRTDLPGNPCIPATIEYVCDTSRSTNIGINGIKIHTVEHVLAAVAAYQIDNLVIEVSNMEPPVGNGSSDVFVEMIENAGICEQDAFTYTVCLQKPLHLTQGDIHLVAVPSHEYRISYTLNYPESKALNAQFQSQVITPANFKKEISTCRTFSLYEEVSTLIDRGLIKGGSLDNAVVIKDDAIFSKNGLFFPDEMCRHKILDMVGDLSLIGFNFHAHLIAIRSGHASNFAFAKMLYNYITMENC